MVAVGHSGDRVARQGGYPLFSRRIGLATNDLAYIRANNTIMVAAHDLADGRSERLKQGIELVIRSIRF